jgi:prepilin-type N-terminal cleavage/methylation domain-containing protein
MRGTGRTTRRLGHRERGFTLVELLITVSIIALMAGMILFALYRAQETAREQKTRALIARLDAIIKSKWENYKTRRVPITIPPNTKPIDAAKMRLDALRDLMRLELPDRWSDIVDDPVAPFPPHPGPPIARPAASQSYKRRYDQAVAAGATPSPPFQSAECLYLVVTATLGEEADGRDVFKAESIGDVDRDGFAEFLDGWGQPIRFVRWPAGFLSELNVEAMGTVTRLERFPPALPKRYMLEFDTQATPEFIEQMPNVSFSASPNAYVGGALVPTDRYSAQPLIETGGSNVGAARITGYEFVDGRYARVICEVPATSIAQPFSGGVPSVDNRYAVVGADPFDPMGVYPLYPIGSYSGPPEWLLRTWAIYPLVFSAGPDRVSDVVDAEAYPAQYTTLGLCPYCISPHAQMMGKPTGGGRWRDNIHNHMQGLR